MSTSNSFSLLALQLTLLNLAHANPLPAAIPTTPQPLTSTPVPCRTTLTSFVTDYYTPQIQMVHTVYTSTETVLSRVPCNGCLLSVVTSQVAPNINNDVIVKPQVPTATITAKKPFTTTSTLCALTTTTSQQPFESNPAQPPKNKNPARAAAAAAATTAAAAEQAQQQKHNNAAAPNSINLLIPIRTLPFQPAPLPTQDLQREHVVLDVDVDMASDTTTTTITMTEKAWPATVTLVKSTACRPTPTPLDGGVVVPAIASLKDDSIQITTGAAAVPKTKTVYKTITAYQTSVRTRTEVRCTTTLASETGRFWTAR